MDDIFTKAALDSAKAIFEGYFDAQKHEASMRAQAKIAMNREDNITHRFVASLQAECILENKRLESATHIAEKIIDISTFVAVELIRSGQYDKAIEQQDKAMYKALSSITNPRNPVDSRLVDPVKLVGEGGKTILPK